MELRGIPCISLSLMKKKEKIVVYQDLLEKKLQRLEDLSEAITAHA